MPADCLDEILVDLAGMDLTRMPRPLLNRWLCASCELVQALPRSTRDRWIGLLASQFLVAFPEQIRGGKQAVRQDLAACVTKAAQDWTNWKRTYAPLPTEVKT